MKDDSSARRCHAPDRPTVQEPRAIAFDLDNLKGSSTPLTKILTMDEVDMIAIQGDSGSASEDKEVELDTSAPYSVPRLKASGEKRGTFTGARCTPREATLPSRRLGASVSSDQPNWTVSAPDIEQAIYTLLCELERSPTDEEIAEKLNLTKDRYHEALLLLHDIEHEIRVRTMKTSEAASSDVTFLSTSRGDAVFCCLRSELLHLFKAAVSTLPRFELLIMQLRYAEDFSGVHISLALNIDESTVTRLSASAHLRLHARLYGSMEADHWIGGDRVQPAEYKGWRTDLTGPKAHIYMSSERCGWLPTGYTWESLGSAATFRHFMKTYFFINDSGEAERVEHSEHVELKVEGYRERH